MSKTKLYKYKLFVLYHDNPCNDKEFNVWAYSEAHAKTLVANKLGLYKYQLVYAARIKIYNYPIYSFFARLFDKVPEKPICIEI